MTNTVKSVLHDATPSWNGYNYQGKVGLYVCLANILKEAEAGIDLATFDTFLDEHILNMNGLKTLPLRKMMTTCLYIRLNIKPRITLMTILKQYPLFYIEMLSHCCKV